MIEIYNSISDWSFKLLEHDFLKNNLSQLTTAYVSSLLQEKSLNNNTELSVVDLYNYSLEKNEFIGYQDLADTCLFREIINYKNNKFSDLQILFGKKGYFTCYKITFKKLELYKELCDNFELITVVAKNNIKHASFYFEED